METITDITPKQKELLEHIALVGGLHGHLRSLVSHVLAICAEEDGLTPQLCEDLYFVTDLANLLEKAEH